MLKKVCFALFAMVFSKFLHCSSEFTVQEVVDIYQEE